MKEYVAYEGRKFSIEWYFTENGKSQPLDFFNALSARADYYRRIKEGTYYDKNDI